MGRNVVVYVAVVGVLVTTTALSGCGLRGGAGPLPAAVADDVDSVPVVRIDAPDSRLVNDPVVDRTRPSVVKIRGVAPSCQKISEGSGFVGAPHRVVSAAHIVAGAESVTVQADGTWLDAQVVSYDPGRDIAVLDVPGLRSPPLPLADGIADDGSDAILLGYPGGGAFAAIPVRIRDVIDLQGPDIYRSTTATREVYTIRGSVPQGDSGGALISLDGKALGVAFGAAVSDPQTGFAVTSREVAPKLAGDPNALPVATGSCVS